MKTRMAQCTILYETWQMQCCGDSIQVGTNSQFALHKERAIHLCMRYKH